MGKAADRKLRELVPDQRFRDWFEALEGRHLLDLNFSEVRRGVQALSSAYVERRSTRMETALAGAGKRAAFAMFYGPLHFLLVQGILDALRDYRSPLDEIVDLGCGTGAAGAAWSLGEVGRPRIRGVERHGWAAGEARWTWHHFGIEGRVHTSDLDRIRVGAKRTGIILAFTVNELETNTRDRLRARLIRAHQRGAQVLIVEPVAERLLPWWAEWAQDFDSVGGRPAQWRFRAELPERLRLMDRAAGLDHQILTGRSLWLGGRE